MGHYPLSEPDSPFHDPRSESTLPNGIRYAYIGKSVIIVVGRGYCRPKCIERLHSWGGTRDESLLQASHENGQTGLLACPIWRIGKCTNSGLAENFRTRNECVRNRASIRASVMMQRSGLASGACTRCTRSPFFWTSPD